MTAPDTDIVCGTASDGMSAAQAVFESDGSLAGDAAEPDDWSMFAPVPNLADNPIDVTSRDGAGSETTTQIVDSRDIGGAGVLKGIGIIGDSNSDEYRADDNRGGAFAATTLNWMEQLVANRGLNFGAWGTRSTPRRTGYEYNWAQSGATASSVLSSGQHTGLAQQVAAGDVTLVVVYIGANDFLRERYEEIYDGTLSGAGLDKKISDVVRDITTAVDTVLGAGRVEILLMTLFDYSVNISLFFEAFPDPVRRQIVTDAIRRVNVGLATMAEQRSIALVDLTAIAVDAYDGVDGTGFLTVGGELIDTVNRGNEPHHLILGDSAGHGGTVSNGFAANLLFIEPVNRSFGASLVPFSDQEILNAAGIKP